jgi:hypothetical protein
MNFEKNRTKIKPSFAYETRGKAGHA